MFMLNKIYQKYITSQYKESARDLGIHLSYFQSNHDNYEFNLKKERFLELQGKISSYGFKPYTIKELIQSGWGGQLVSLNKAELEEEINLILDKNSKDLYFFELYLANLR